MWFKNVLVYKLNVSLDLTDEELQEKLTQEAFIPCGSHDSSRFGWTTPLSAASDDLFFRSEGRILLCAKREDKVLPASVVRELLDDKVREIQEREDRPVHRKEKESLKEEIMFECLPRAFTRSRLTWGYLDTQLGLLCIDSSSHNRAEDWIKLLRTALGSLPVVPLQVVENPMRIMTRWLHGDPMPLGLQLGSECELREPGEEGSILRCKHQELLAEEMDAHLQSGKRVVKLLLHWDERLQVVVGEDLSMKRLKFADKLVTEAKDSAQGDKVAQFDADFALMAGTLAEFIPQLVESFGGMGDVGEV